jgi:hypothetical protein
MRKFVLVLVVLALVGLAADRLAHRVATDEAESRLAAEGLSAVSVEVGSFPFLDQVLRRQFDQVSVRASSLRTDAGRAELIRLTARDVTAGSDGTATAGTVSARGTVTYAEVLRQVDREGLSLSGGGGGGGDGKVRVTGDVTFLGQTLTASAVGRVEVRGRRLQIVPTNVELEDGTAVDVELARGLADRLSLDYRLPDLPDGVVVRRIAPAASGLVVTVSGRDVAFSDIG